MPAATKAPVSRYTTLLLEPLVHVAQCMPQPSESQPTESQPAGSQSARLMAGAEASPRPPRPHPSFRALRWIIGTAVCLALIAAGLAIGSHALSRYAERRAHQALQDAYGGELEIQGLHISLFPKARVTLDRLVLHQRAQPNAETGLPLISIERVSAEAGLWELLRSPIHLRRMRLQKLAIHVPPRHQGEGRFPTAQGARSRSARFVIDEVIANGTTLEILPKDANKEPLEFDIRELVLNGAGPDRPMKFRAVLTNAKPPGDIHSTGTFGPWQLDDPALTPVQGNYTFQNADLSVFHGIAGTLSSQGSYQGVLDHIAAQGTTDTPDFTVRVSGNPVRLTTQFKAVIDGMNGDTYLDPVNGRFGNSSLTARGMVVGNRGEHGKVIKLDVQFPAGRLEDVLRLGVKGTQPPMTGVISFRTQLIIPRGPVEIPEKLYLDGQFDAGQARFNQFKVQERVDQLSRRGSGEVTQDQEQGDVASDFRGRFTLNNGILTLHGLSFQVPGVQVSLNGTYGLPDERLDLHGTARLQAKLSQTVTGFKSVLLKAFDPLFAKKGAGILLPIKIQGTRSSPSFGLDVKKTLKETL
jgi:hypothetical protein